MRINFDRFGPCLAKIAARGRLNEQEARDILQEVASRAEQMRRSGTQDPFVTAAKTLAAGLNANAKADLRDALSNARLRNFNKGNIKQLVANTGRVADAADFIESMLVQINRTMEGTESPVEDNSDFEFRRAQSEVDSALRRINAYKVATSSRGVGIDRETSIAMFEARGMGPKLPKATPSLAEQVAEAFMGPLNKMSERMRAAGARFTDAIDYATTTRWSPRQMMEDGFDKWRAAEEPRMNEYTFRNLTPKERQTVAQARTEFLRSVYNAVITGVHMGSTHHLLADGDGYIAPAFEGTHNLAKQFSHERVIFWKDGSAWYDHMRQYGDMTSLYDTVQQTLRNGTRATALMESLGTNPPAQLNLLTRWVEENWRNSSPQGVIEFQKKIPHLKYVMDQLDGTSSRPVNEMGAQLGLFARLVESITKLGNVGVTHGNSIAPTSIAAAPHYGISRFEQAGNVLRNVVRHAVGSAERQEILDEAGAFVHGNFAHFLSKAYNTAGDNMLHKIMGITSSLTAMEMRATGLNFVMESGRNGFMYTLMSKLGAAVGKEWQDVHSNIRETLGHSGIGRLEWDLMRATSPAMHVVEGIRYMTPKDLERIPDADMEGYLRAKGKIDRGAPPEIVAKEIAKGRWALQSAYGGYLDYAGRTAVIAAGARERAWAQQGTRVGTVPGELMRMFYQFKMWPMAVINQIWLREIYSSHSMQSKVGSLSLYFTLATLFGYNRMFMRDIGNGNPPRDPYDPKTMLAAFAQGGGLGIYGDFAFGEVSRMNQNFASTLAGPVAGEASDIMDLFSGSVTIPATLLLAKQVMPVEPMPTFGRSWRGSVFTKFQPRIFMV